jgi:hypothetical protein
VPYLLTPLQRYFTRIRPTLAQLRQSENSAGQPVLSLSGFYALFSRSRVCGLGYLHCDYATRHHTGKRFHATEDIELSTGLRKRVMSQISHIRRQNNTCAQVPPRFELGLLDSESRVLTVTPRNRSMSIFDETHKIDRLTPKSTMQPRYVAVGHCTCRLTFIACKL